MTADGGAIVANDMHLGLAMPNIWYRASMVWHDGRERRLTGVTLPEGEDYDTIAGLVLSLLGRIPERGEAATLDVPGVKDDEYDEDDDSWTVRTAGGIEFLSSEHAVKVIDVKENGATARVHRIAVFVESSFAS